MKKFYFKIIDRHLLKDHKIVTSKGIPSYTFCALEEDEYFQNFHEVNIVFG